MSIWTSCNGIKHQKYMELEPWRMVEAQHISSSRDLVDSSEEHSLLENLLENSKPQIHPQKHYLIFTPFRYPPLAYGSRFGTAYEPSLWYGSLNLRTTLAEVAFYRLQFFEDTEANLEFIEIPMTAFKAYLQTHKGIDLTKAPFNHYRDQISHKKSYAYSQELGTEMREADIEAFIFTSARDNKLGANVGVFSQEAFKTKDKNYISTMQNWRCMANQEVIEFTREDIMGKQRYEFYLEELAQQF